MFGYGFYELDPEPVAIIRPEVPDRYSSMQAADQFWLAARRPSTPAKEVHASVAARNRLNSSMRFASG